MPLIAAIPATPWTGLAGGALIGLASLLALAVSGKIPGISGVFGRLLRPKGGDFGWRLTFLLGLIGGAAATFALFDPAAAFGVPGGRSLIVFAIGGFLVGFGTRLGGGCTSGHGVCGIGMGARDAFVATLVFMGAGMVTVLIWNQWVASP